MKIIQLIYSLSSGGAEHFVVDLSNQLAEMGHDVTVCILLDGNNETLTFNKQFLKSNVKFHSLNFNRGFSLNKAFLVETFLKDQKPEIVYCHLNVIPYIFRLAYCDRNIKFVHTIHSIASKSSGLKIQYYFNKYFYKKNIIRPVTISKECNLSFIEYYSLDNPVCIENGCSPVVPSNFFSTIQLEVESYKTYSNTPVFVHVARCHPVKNQQLLIDAFNNLNKEGVDFLLLIIGNGFWGDQNKVLVESACDKIHFLGEKKNVGDYLLCADAFCLSSIYEGLPISLIEAMSCGLTPICTAVGGIPDVVKDGDNGYLSELNSASFTDAVRRFLNNKIEVCKLKECYNEFYSMEKCARKYVELIELYS